MAPRGGEQACDCLERVDALETRVRELERARAGDKATLDLLASLPPEVRGLQVAVAALNGRLTGAVTLACVAIPIITFFLNRFLGGK